MKKTLSLAVVDISSAFDIPDDNALVSAETRLRRQLNALQLRKVKAACRNVRLTAEGYFIRGKHRDDWPSPDWRGHYAAMLNRLFPGAWVYGGGHHLALHETPPGPKGLAGFCLLRIVEANALVKLSCGRHYGPPENNGRCAKCASGITARDIATQRDRALVAALEPIQ